MGRPVVHFEVIGNDGDALRAYYSGLFGWEFEDSPPSAEALTAATSAPGPLDYGFVQPSGDDGGSGIPGGVGGLEGAADDDFGYVTFYVQVPDVEEALANAEELGGERVSGPQQAPGAGLVIGHFRDPEGHLVGVAQVSS